MALSVQQCLDLVNSTRDHFTLDKLSVALNYPRYEVLNDILKNHKKVGAGENWETNIQLTDASNGGQVGMLFNNDTSNQTDTDKKVVTPWRRYTNNCSYDRIALSINAGEKTRVYNYLKSKMTSMYRKSADDMQNIFWGAPTGAADTTSALGVSSWLTLGTNDTSGFTGGDASYQDGNTFNPGGLDPSVYSKWNSYYADHNGNLGETLLDQLGDACRATDFEAPMSPGKVEGVDENAFNKMRFYTSNEVIKQVEKVARNSDDRIGYDLGKYKGKTLYKGIPFNYVKILDTANSTLYGTNPLYAINFDQLYPIVLEDWYFQPDTDKNAFSHTVMTQYTDLVWNLHCDNRQQAGFLISQQ
jgi:hypothetical protein